MTHTGKLIKPAAIWLTTPRHPTIGVIATVTAAAKLGIDAGSQTGDQPANLIAVLISIALIYTAWHLIGALMDDLRELTTRAANKAHATWKNRHSTSM